MQSIVTYSKLKRDFDGSGFPNFGGGGVNFSVHSMPLQGVKMCMKNKHRYDFIKQVSL